MKINLPNSAHLGNIDSFLRGVDSFDPTRFELTIHERWVSVHPFALALTACMGATCRHQGGQVTANVPDHRSIAYLIRMGLFGVLGVQPGRDITEHEASGRFIPLTQIRSTQDLKSAIKDLVPLLHAPPQVADPIRYVFSEMARNVLEHSQSPVGAFVCAQYYQSSNRIAIGIADAGIGIKKSIGASHRVTDDASAMRLALQPGITGTTSRIGGTEFNAGAGLFFTKSIAALARNIFVLYSGGTAFKLLPGPAAKALELHADPTSDSHRFLVTPTWPGTVVGIDVSVQEAVEFSSLLSQIREAYAIDVKKSRKAYYKQIRFRR